MIEYINEEYFLFKNDILPILLNYKKQYCVNFESSKKCINNFIYTIAIKNNNTTFIKSIVELQECVGCQKYSKLSFYK